MEPEALRRLGARVANVLREHPGAAVIVVGRVAQTRELRHALAQFRPGVASAAFAADLPEALREGITLYDATALADAGPRVADRATAILIEGEAVRILERA